MTDKFDIYQHVTDRLIELMETEGTNWSKPWRAVAGNQPHNAASGRTYKGVNPALLSHRACPAWASFKQWQEKGYSVQKGEKGSIVVFWKRFIAEDKETGDKKIIPLLKYYRVFNGEQVKDADGRHYHFDAPVITDTFDRVANADRVINETGAVINTVTGDRAFYNSGSDQITMPAAGQFENAGGYYGTLLHELGHWTGHKSRLDRTFGKRFGDNAYAFEELVAEFTSAFLGARLEIDSEPRADHAQYLNNWLSVLRDDKKAIFTAISAAKKASEFIYPETKEEDEELAA